MRPCPPEPGRPTDPRSIGVVFVITHLMPPLLQQPTSCATYSLSPVSLVPWRDYEQLRHHPYWQKFVHKRWTPRGCEGCAELGRTCDGGCRASGNCSGWKNRRRNRNEYGGAPATSAFPSCSRRSEVVLEDPWHVSHVWISLFLTGLTRFSGFSTGASP